MFMTDTETTQSVDQARQVALTVQLFLHDRAGHPVSRVEIVILFTQKLYYFSMLVRTLLFPADLIPLLFRLQK